MSDRRRAVVLFNLGGPDEAADVRPFLRNLFSDPAIIDLPAIARWPLAELISRARERTAIGNYSLMGGGSPLLGETRAQATALESALEAMGLPARVFVAMRYWSPTTEAVAREVADYAPDDVVLTPLYPQYSTTTTASSLAAWRKVYRGPGETRAICCWHDNEGLIAAHAEAILSAWREARQPKVRLLFSAHGIPQRTADRGDPYAWQVGQTCRAIADRLGEGWDWQICYQSRVGPMKWLGPTTPEAIAGAVAEGLGVLIDPVAFVSEHIETLVELDRDYARLAERLGATAYLRAPTVGTAPMFIGGLASAVAKALERRGSCPDGPPCPAGLSRCGRDRECSA